MIATILLVVVTHQWPCLSVPDGLDTTRIYTFLGKEVFNSFGPAAGKEHVICLCSNSICMTANFHGNTTVLP